MADDQLPILNGIVQNQHGLQERMVEQNRQRNHELPTYSGKAEEDVLEFVETVNREAVAGNWSENQKLKLAKGALREIASEWRWLHDAEAPRDWDEWSDALCAAFRKRCTFGEWEKMVTTKVQQTNETGQQVSGIELITETQWSVLGDNVDNVEMEKLLTRYGHLFHDPSFLKSTTVAEDHQPLRSAPYRVSHTEREAIRSQVEEMLQAGIVEPSTSPWPSPVVMVPKKNGVLYRNGDAHQRKSNGDCR